MTIHPIQEGSTQTLAEQLMAAIQTAIVKGDLAPGSKLREPDLARRYGTSRGPLREAIRRLEGRRLVEVAPHTGARVARLSLGQLLELYEGREVLEGLACRLAAERVTTTEADGLKRLLEEHERDVVASEGREYFQAEGDLDLHFRLAQASGNGIVTKILCDDLYHLMRMYRYRFSLRPDRPVAALKEHWRIIDAIADRDGELAELLMRRHIRSTRNAIERHFSNPDQGEFRS
jgi:DNA-binding GntR family transcriptional regulator